MLDKVQIGLVFAPKHYLIFWLSNLLILSVSDEGYSRNGLCALNVIPTILLLSLGRYRCWRTICLKEYHPPSSQCFGTDMAYQIYFIEIYSS
jgi:ABC-type nickel/cobalt efflux system permease component RcnA